MNTRFTRDFFVAPEDREKMEHIVLTYVDLDLQRHLMPRPCRIFRSIRSWRRSGDTPFTSGRQESIYLSTMSKILRHLDPWPKGLYGHIVT